MDSKILSYADEILSFDVPESRRWVRLYLLDFYDETTDVADAVISVLEGEGYFDAA